ncbi:unnamed protein product [Clonostachys solani]|uniref:Uncharacterized protein n=1 Tax=Clonostachys solani TaxID=160281 RepID=A0A9N9ZE60_9HYPO|nr:unnamed protein product [Clonostachys solani]
MKGTIWPAIVASVASLVQAAPVEVDADIIPNQFIVQLRPGIPASAILEHHQAVRELHSRGLSQRDGLFSGLGKTFSAGDFNAYAGAFDSATIAEIAALPEVLKVEPDRWVHPAALVTQTDVEWHLGSISHRAENSTEYIYDDSAAEGRFAYVVDSGIRWSHEEFEGRASHGYNAVNGSENGDQTGHGTHVASILAGKVYGVAKKATVIDVKVFGVGTSTSATIIDGITWAVNDIVANNRQHLSVINLSLGGPDQEVLDNAVKNIYNLGILPVCAAGNENVDVSTRSPGRTPECLTVGNVESSLRRNNVEGVPSGSNYGAAVDIFAPGTDVVAASSQDDTASKANTGTSMAAPAVAGLALYFQRLEGLATPEEVTSRIIELSTKDVVKEARGSQNRLAYNGNA